MEELSTWEMAYVFIVIGLRATLQFAPFVLVMVVGSKANWSWWKLISGSVVCVFAPILMLPLYQIADGATATWKSWLGRCLIAGVLIFGSPLLIDSYWMQTNTFLQDSFAAAVLILSEHAGSTTGTGIITLDGDEVVFSGHWGTALFMLVFGAAIGTFYLRNTFAAIVAFASLGFVASALLTANHFAWQIDLQETNQLNGWIRDASAQAHFFLPMQVLVWLGLLVLTRLPAYEPEFEDSSAMAT